MPAEAPKDGAHMPVLLVCIGRSFGKVQAHVVSLYLEANSSQVGYKKGHNLIGGDYSI